jgi:dihydropteroate synthase
VISALAGLNGAWGVRVHDVRASVDALKVLGAWSAGGLGVPPPRRVGGERWGHSPRKLGAHPPEGQGDDPGISNG